MHHCISMYIIVIHCLVLFECFFDGFVAFTCVKSVWQASSDTFWYFLELCLRPGACNSGLGRRESQVCGLCWGSFGMQWVGWVPTDRCWGRQFCYPHVPTRQLHNVRHRRPDGHELRWMHAMSWRVFSVGRWGQCFVTTSWYLIVSYCILLYCILLYPIVIFNRHVFFRLPRFFSIWLEEGHQGILPRRYHRAHMAKPGMLRVMSLLLLGALCTTGVKLPPLSADTTCLGQEQTLLGCNNHG